MNSHFAQLGFVFPQFLVFKAIFEVHAQNSQHLFCSVWTFYCTQNDRPNPTVSMQKLVWKTDHPGLRYLRKTKWGCGLVWCAKDALQWKTTFNERRALVADDLQWKTNFNERQLSLKRTFNKGHIIMESYTFDWTTATINLTVTYYFTCKITQWWKKYSDRGPIHCTVM